MSNLADDRDQSYRKKYNNSISRGNDKNEDQQLFYVSNTESCQNNFNLDQKSYKDYTQNDFHTKFQKVINSFPKQEPNFDKNTHSVYSNFNNPPSNKNNFTQSIKGEKSGFDNSLQSRNDVFMIRQKENEETDKAFEMSHLNKNKPKEKTHLEELNFSKNKINNPKRKSVDKSNLLFYSASQDFENDNKIKNPNNSNYSLMNTIEKDRMIFEYSKLMKDTKIENEEIKKAFEAREEIVTQLLEDNKLLNCNLKNIQAKLNSKDEEIEKLKHFFEEKLYQIEKEKCNLELKSNEISRKFEEQTSETLNLKASLKKLETDLQNYKKILGKQDEQNLKTEKKLDELRKENMKIPSLKKSLQDLERKNQDLLEEIEKEKAISNKILKKERLISSEELMDKDQIETEYWGNILKSNKLAAIDDTQKIKFECENLKKELDDKKIEIQNISEKYRQIFAENENFIKFISNEILNFNSFFESFPRLDLRVDSEIKLKPNINTNFDKSDFKMLSLQYDIIKKNFDLIKQNFEIKYNENFGAYAKSEKTNSENEEKIKNLLKEKDSIYLDLSVYSQQIKDFSESSNKLLNENRNLLEILSNLQNTCLKLNSENEELKALNEDWRLLKNNLNYNLTEKINFLHTKFDIYYAFKNNNKKEDENINHKIGTPNKNLDNENNISVCKNNRELNVNKSFKDPEEQLSFINNESHHDGILNLTKSEKENEKSVLGYRLNEESKACFAEKLCDFIDWFILEYSGIHLLNQELKENNNFFRQEIKKLNEERDNLDKRIDTLMIRKEEQLKEKDEQKAVEINELKESLLEQIYKLTALNHKNNLLIDNLENEIAQLKEINKRYETNLRLLTGSHEQLEKSIHNNFQVLNEEIEKKESKYNFLLRENQIKETHLKSLESMLKRKKDENEPNQLINYESESQKNLNFQNNSEEDNLKSTADFVFNANKEDELNALIAYSNKQTALNPEANLNIGDRNENNRLFNDSKNEFQSNSAQSFFDNKNVKVPGRIYSFRK